MQPRALAVAVAAQAAVQPLAAVPLALLQDHAHQQRRLFLRRMPLLKMLQELQSQQPQVPVVMPVPTAAQKHQLAALAAAT